MRAMTCDPTASRRQSSARRCPTISSVRAPPRWAQGVIGSCTFILIVPKRGVPYHAPLDDEVLGEGGAHSHTGVGFGSRAASQGWGRKPLISDRAPPPRAEAKGE